MALKAGRVGVNPNYVDKEGRPLYDNSYLKELLRKEGIITLFTKEGNPISIDNAVAGRVYDLAVTMAPKQAGTGTPSPTNPRAISGYTGLTITVNSVDNAIDFDTTVYGGLYSTGNGITVTWAKCKLSDLTWSTQTSAFANFKSTSLASLIKRTNSEIVIVSDSYLADSNNGAVSGRDYQIYTNSDGEIKINDTRYTTAEEFMTAMGDSEICYVVATPSYVPLSAQSINLATGSNTVSSDTGTTIDLKYLGTLVPGGANGRSLNRSLNLNREVIDTEERKEIQEEIKEVPVEEPVTVKKSTKKSTK